MGDRYTIALRKTPKNSSSQALRALITSPRSTQVWNISDVSKLILSTAVDSLVWRRLITRVAGLTALVLLATSSSLGKATCGSILTPATSAKSDDCDRQFRHEEGAPRACTSWEWIRWPREIDILLSFGASGRLREALHHGQVINTACQYRSLGEFILRIFQQNRLWKDVRHKSASEETVQNEILQKIEFLKMPNLRGLFVEVEVNLVVVIR
jgi:hypothetical protein